MKIFRRLILSFWALGSLLWGVEIDSAQGLRGGKDFLFQTSVGDSVGRQRSEFEKMVEGDTLEVGFSDSVPLESQADYLLSFRENLDEVLDSFLRQDRARQKLPLFLYKENGHYYSPSPMRQDVQFEEFIIQPFLLRKYQLYQDYSPFWGESLSEGSVYFSPQKYEMPILLTKAELAQGYSSSDMDQAIVNIYKSRVYNCLDFQLGFNGSSGKWLTEQMKEKTKDLYGSLGYYWDDYLSLDYSYLHLDHDLPAEKLFFKTVNSVSTSDSIFDVSSVSYKSQQHFVVFRSIIFDAGYNYSHSEFLCDSLLNIDKSYNAEGYFYALDLDFWGQNLAVGRKSYRNYLSTKIDQREYYKGELQTHRWYGASLSGYYDSENTSFSLKKGLPWGLGFFADYVDKQNLAIDTALFLYSGISFNRVEAYKSTFAGLTFGNKLLSGRLAYGNLEQDIAEYQVFSDSFTVNTQSYQNDLLQADLKARLPFSLWGQKMALAYGVQTRRFLSGEVPYIYPEVQLTQSYELIFYFNYGNVLTLGWREYEASDYFDSFSDRGSSQAISSNKVLDYYLNLELTKKFSVLMDIKNYDKDKNYLGTTPYRRHFKMNFVWYLFD